jgi:hypothetical protein
MTVVEELVSPCIPPTALPVVPPCNLFSFSCLLYEELSSLFFFHPYLFHTCLSSLHSVGHNYSD